VVDFVSFKKIKIELNILEDAEILNYKNEYKHVLLNLLTNAKDVLSEQVISLPKITIEINGKLVKVKDNGKGVDIQNIHKIFEPYFTTKKQGLGIGLYMSKMIIEKNMRGVIGVTNDEDGAVFKINLEPL